MTLVKIDILRILKLDRAENKNQEIKYYRYFMPLLFVAGAILRFYHLGTKSLWFDELHTYKDALKNLPLWDKPHFLYFKLVRFFLNFGHSEVWLRTASALCGIFGVLAVYLAGKEVFKDRRVGILGALLIATSKNHIYYSQEARYYPVMFLLAALSIWLFARFINQGCLISLFLLPFSCIMNYLIHPTTLVISGIILIWIPLSLVVSSRGRKILKRAFQFMKSLFKNTEKPYKSKKNRKKVPDKTPMKQKSWFKLLILITVLLVITTGFLVSWKLAKIALSQVRNIKLFKAPAEGVFATRNFFFTRHFLYYGPIAPPKGFLYTYIVGAFILFSIVGYIRAIIKKTLFGSLFVVVLFATFTLLFSIHLKQWYSNKYVFFLYPLNIICISYGAISVLDALRKLIPPKIKAYQLPITVVLCLLFIIPNLYKDYKFIRVHYGHKGTDIKGVVRYASERMGKNDYISAYGVITEVVDYYAKYYNIAPEQYLPLEGERGDGTRSVFRLINAAENGGNIWYIYGWPHDIRTFLNDWVKDHFDEVFRHETVSDEKYDVILWKWKYKGKVLGDETPVSLNLSFDTPPKDKRSPDFFGDIETAQADVYVSHEMYALIQYKGKPEDLPSSFTLSVFADEKLLGNFEKQSDSLPGEISLHFPMPSGTIPLGFLIKSPELTNKKPRSLSFLLSSRYPNRKFFHATGYDDSTHTYDISCKTEKNLSFLHLPYNSYVSYEMNIPQTGMYQFALNAKNDKPGPILFHIETDDSPVGILAYLRGDNSWETKKFPLPLKKGNHCLSIFFFSDIVGGKNTDSLDNDGFLSYFSLEKLQQRVSGTDQRLILPGNRLFSLSRYLPTERLLLDQGKRTWKANKLSSPQNKKIKTQHGNYLSLVAKVPFDSKGGSFFSPVFPVKKGQIVYFTIKAKTKSLYNHSANVMILFFDKNLKIKFRQWANAQGITGDVDETKFVFLKTVPKGVNQGLISFSVYANSKRQSKDTGTVWFYDFRMEKELIPDLK